MYRRILHSEDNLAALKKELTVFRAKISARRMREMGITDEQLANLLDENIYVPIEAKGL